MSEDARRLFAKFRRDNQTKLVSTFIISEEKSKVDAWPKDKKKTPQEMSDAADISVQKVTEAEDASEEERKSKDRGAFDRLAAEYLGEMNAFFRLIPNTMSILPVVEQIDIHRTIYERSIKDATLISKDEEFEVYEMRFDQVGRIDRDFEAIKSFQAGRKLLPGMFLMGLISSYDAFLAKLLKLFFVTKPEALSSSERNISFKDLASLGSVEAAREMILEKEIESVLRLSHHAQFEWLGKQLGISLTKNLEIWPSFVEICERRNLHTHTQGVVSLQYLKVCAEQNLTFKNKPKVGEKLGIGPDYLRNAISVISELGLKLAQVVWRKLIPSEIDVASESLSNIGYNLIVLRRYRLACKMLDFGLNEMKKHGEEGTRKRMVVNYANAKKLLGEKEEAAKILSGEDWTAVSDIFRFCVAAVKDDVPTLIGMMPKMVGSEEMSKQDIRDWPVFRGVKDNQEFVAAFEKTFGEPYFTDKTSADKADTATDSTLETRRETKAVKSASS